MECPPDGTRNGTRREGAHRAHRDPHRQNVALGGFVIRLRDPCRFKRPVRWGMTTDPAHPGRWARFCQGREAHRPARACSRSCWCQGVVRFSTLRLSVDFTAHPGERTHSTVRSWVGTAAIVTASRAHRVATALDGDVNRVPPRAFHTLRHVPEYTARPKFINGCPKLVEQRCVGFDLTQATAGCLSGPAKLFDIAGAGEGRPSPRQRSAARSRLPNTEPSSSLLLALLGPG